MSEGTPKAIEMMGIVRNATKIGVQDGQAEDLINLRFMDGGWRASGNGRQIENMPTGTIYEQLYVHTNIYHHLLGVNNGTLYWFAEIDNDGVTFYPLDGTTDRSQWPEDKQDLPTERVALTTVTGSMWVTQTGHLLTIIDEADDFEFIVFKRNSNEYKNAELDVNGKPTDRGIYPFGHIFFNLHQDKDAFEEEEFDLGTDDEQTATLCNDHRITVLSKVVKKNKFSRPFLVVAALQLYDGSYMYASAPQLMFPSQNAAPYYKNYYRTSSGAPVKLDSSDCDWYAIPGGENGGYYGTFSKGSPWALTGRAVPQFNFPPFCCGGVSQNNHSAYKMKARNIAFDLTCSVESVDKILKENSELFKAFCIFITPEVDFYKNEDGEIKNFKLASSVGAEYYEDLKVYEPNIETMDKLKYTLFHSNFYLLKKYTSATISELMQNNIVDLQTSALDEFILETIDIGNSKELLDIESSARMSYLPKVTYYYNGRLHIANYKARQFDGYPIDSFILNNHSVVESKTQGGTIGEVVPLLGDSDYSYATQWNKSKRNYLDYDYYFDEVYPEGAGDAAIRIKGKGDIFASITVKVVTDSGDQYVSRYIDAFDTTNPKWWTPRFIEDLSPILSFPDQRANEMTIRFMLVSSNDAVVFYKKTFTLVPHPYLNIAYFASDNLAPIALNSFSGGGLDYDQHSTLDGTDGISLVPYEETGIVKLYLKGQEGVDYYVTQFGPIKPPVNIFDTEYFPNGLKVSKTDQPMFFPVENTYQVGSAEILALMSNTIAVGTGQTGDAPLYVFCKDGVYALYVDDSGQMAYPNARILARDVCNNPRSVTPIDAGVVFTTDRGLMMIAGEQVLEIGAPAEGDVVQFWNSGSVDYSKIATASMQQIADLPSELCSATDFLTYLQDKGTSGKAAIINYNHNMRELMVSNPNYPYSYVLDREGNWSRRDYTASQYVNNYPTSYRVDADGHFYKVDDEGDANTTLEHRKEADNKIFYLSNVIKLDSIGFKQAYRFVVRGYFETIFANREMITDTIDDRKIIVMGLSIDNLGIGEVLRMAYLHIYGMDAWVSVGEHGEVGDILALEIYDALTLENITKTFRPTGMPGEYITLIKTETTERPAVACVVEGSYDGRKFKPLGYNRKSGKFRDIGCIVERTDVRFFRICLSGQVTGKTRIDYMEMSAGASMLNTKIR